MDACDPIGNAADGEHVVLAEGEVEGSTVPPSFDHSVTAVRRAVPPLLRRLAYLRP
jgi:hypothetical protein